ncbi:hypothetical protein [Nonomuraea sp. JJY05]
MPVCRLWSAVPTIESFRALTKVHRVEAHLPSLVRVTGESL